MILQLWPLSKADIVRYEGGHNCKIDGWTGSVRGFLGGFAGGVGFAVGVGGGLFGFGGAVGFGFAPLLIFGHTARIPRPGPG